MFSHVFTPFHTIPRHVRVNLDDDRKSRHSGWQFDALNCTEEDLQLERRLRVGTV